MRSLFVKIFLWFWLAHIMVVVLFSDPLRFEPEHERMDATIGSLIAMHGEKAAGIADRDGRPALRHYVEEVNRATGIRILLFGDSGEELLGQSAPSGLGELVRDAATNGEARMKPAHGWPPVFARRVSGSEGRPYVVVGELPPGPIANWFATPYLLVLRLAAVVSVTGVVCYGLARYLTGPVRRLRTSARQLADGDLTVRVGAAVHNRRDEMGDLGRDFDFMAERIESLVSAQRRLLSDMSHELRSPLARLNVALGLARQRTGPEATAVLDRIEREAQRLNDLIGQLLTLARLEASTKVEEESQVDVAALLREVVADAQFEARGCNRQVRLLGCEECTVTGMPELLRSAIENVVRNGLRYTPEGSPIEISLRRERDDGKPRTLVRVRDHGPGVPESSIADIFRPFYRVGDDRDRQSGGVGLGLAIAQQAVRLHGGTISAANAPDGGLIVEISLPLPSGRE